jgi:hypothetical protein
MHEQLVPILVAFALVVGAGSALPYGHSLVAPASLAGGVPDEPGNERPRLLVTVASKGTHSVPALASQHSTVQSASIAHLLTMDPAALARLSSAAPPFAVAVTPVPLRC